MAVAKWKLEIDRELRGYGCRVIRGRIYEPSGKFWGTRLEWNMLSSGLQSSYIDRWKNSSSQ